MINIVVPVHGQQELLEQLITTTNKYMELGPQYRWFIVDSASPSERGFSAPQDVPSYLATLSPDKYTIVTLPENKGFARACNAGIDAVKAHYANQPPGLPQGHICFLNSDTFPTFGTFSCLEKALMSSSDIGAAGPVSNCVSGPQQVIRENFSSKWFLEQWVRQYVLQEHANERLEVDRLVGFCLLVKDGVWQQVGHFDENFGIGNYEDDDYCMRVKALGYKLVIAFDSFLYHYGSQTLVAMGVTGQAFDELMTKNRAYFESKWKPNGPAKVEQTPTGLLITDAPIPEHSKVQSSGLLEMSDPITKAIQAKAVISSDDPPSAYKRVTGIVLGIPNHAGTIHRHTVASLMAIEGAIVRAGIPLQLQVIPCAALHEARQNVVDNFIKSDGIFSHCIFIDDDMTFGPDAAMNLIADAEQYDLDFVSNVAFINGDPTGPNIFGLREDRPEYGEQSWWDCMTVWPEDQLFEIAAAGMAFCLVSRRMVTKMREDEKPDWCHFIYGELRSEDVAFCINARRKGFRLFCDSRATVGHIYREVQIIDRETYRKQNGAAGMRLPIGQTVTGHCRGGGPYVEYKNPQSLFASDPSAFDGIITFPVPGETVLFPQLAPKQAAGVT